MVQFARTPPRAVLDTSVLVPFMTFISVVPPFDNAWDSANDPNDLPIWSAAVRSGAQFIVSHNLHDFPPRNSEGLCAYDGIEFVTTENFVRDILALNVTDFLASPIPPSGHIAHRHRI